MTKKSRARADAFSSLLGGLPVTTDAAQGVPLDQIRVRPGQPRRYFDDGALDSLTESVRQQGILQPVLLRPVTGGYELIAGERRLRAARQAGLSEIPASVREVSDEDVPLLAALENLQRQDLNPLDEVEAILALTAQELQVPTSEVVPLLHAQRRTPDPDTVARLDAVFSRLGRGTWTSFAANRAGVLRFPPDLLTLMRSGQLEYTRAAALARIKDDALRREWTQRALEEGLGVREIAAAQRSGGSALTSRTQRVRKLMDDRRIAALGRREQTRVQKLLEELETLLGGPQDTD